MKAIVLHPSKIDAVTAAKIALGNLKAIKECFANHTMTTQGTIENVGYTDPSEINEFLEWCFEYTNCDEEYHKDRRGMSVGDVLIVFNIGAFACMNSGWERIE